LSFGYHRLEILGALSNGLILVFVSGSLLWEAWGRFFEPVFVEGKTVVWVALLGLGVNAIAMRVLHSHHEHSLNARAAYLHVVSDLLGSVGALVSGGLLWWKGWTWIDPAVTVLFSLVMIWGAWRLLREGVEVLLEAAPRRIDLEEVQRALETCSGVERVHDLHVWSLTKSRVALSAHLVVGESNELQNGVLLRQATDLLQSNFGIAHVTLQIESSEFFEDCHTHCAD
jgi:cobalt-zinc-cadmium efflux system protein